MSFGLGAVIVINKYAVAGDQDLELEVHRCAFPDGDLFRHRQLSCLPLLQLRGLPQGREQTQRCPLRTHLKHDINPSSATSIFEPSKDNIPQSLYFLTLPGLDEQVVHEILVLSL
jgi:hypothetical protein